MQMLLKVVLNNHGMLFVFQAKAELAAPESEKDEPAIQWTIGEGGGQWPRYRIPQHHSARRTVLQRLVAHWILQDSLNQLLLQAILFWE